MLASHPGLRQLGEALGRKRTQTIRAEGLCASSAPLMFAALASARRTLPTLLFVMGDADEAGYFYHDLTQMMGEERVLYFPSSYRRAIKYNQKDAASEILRTEVLGRVAMAGGQPLLIVTYPEALAENVVSRQVLDAHTIVVRRGDSLDFQRLEDDLDRLGFVRVDYVYEPGQYAIRGSIVDIYSFAAETPFRIDFFGDEVESIRTYDVQTQLSDSVVEEMSVVPEMKSEGTQYISIFEFLPQDCVVVSRDLTYAADRVEQIYREGFSLQAVLEDRAQALPEFEEAALAEELGKRFHRLVTTPETFDRGLSGLRRILLSAVADEQAPVGKGEERVTFRTTAQPLFHKNFELVERECRRWELTGYRLLILADSPKQMERLQAIFGSLQPPMGFEPVLRTIHEGYIDHELRLCLFTDHQVFDRYHKYNLRSERARKGKVALTLRELQQFEVGDYVVHIDHGVGRFGGLVNVPNNDGNGYQEMIKILYANDDVVYVSIHSLHKISKYKGREGEPPRVSRLGTGAWERMKERVKTKVKDIARDLIRLYSKRMREKGFAFSKDTYLQQELEASFLYEDTADQLKATQDVKEDMERDRPMDRLVCGDVGFGKTEVAVRAAFKAATDGKQVAVLVPTTVLAYQHYQTFTKRLKDFPVKVEYLSRARMGKALQDVLRRLAEGEVDIVIGTHKLIGKSVKFKDLGLLIVDEEQKFGVGVKEKLRQMKVNVDTLTMTATPIPRTLQFSLMGARDLSVIQTPPPNRYPIQTELHSFSAEVIAEAINFEMSRNGQVFFVNNRISNLNELAAMIQKSVPDARVCIGHGRMDPKELEQIVFDFMNYDYDVLLSTTIIESGIDVPNANTIIINNAHNYGLSDLHQMRGRVGRSNKKAFCYLLAPPLAALPDDARRRLQAIENFSDLGSGLHIAMQDLDIRGAGNMLGAEQSGFIADLGYETYQKVLAEAMQELRNEVPEATELETDAQPEGAAAPEVGQGLTAAVGGGLQGERVWGSSTDVESDIPAFFGEYFVPSPGERMSLYRELDSFTSPAQIDAYRTRLVDRFGKIPEEAEELIRIVPLKWEASRLGIDRLILKQGRMILYLVPNRMSPYYQSEAFMRLINYATAHARQCQFRDNGKPSILIKDVTTIAQALSMLEEMNGGIR